MRLFPWLGPREFVCGGCGSTSFAHAAAARMSCEKCRHVTEVSAMQWLAVSAIAVEHADPHLPCPTCATPFELSFREVPKTLRCRSGDGEIPIRRAGRAEAEAVFGIVAVAKHPREGEVQLLDREKVTNEWKSAFRESEIFQRVGLADLTIAELEHYARTGSAGERVAAAANRNLDRETAALLAKDDHPAVRIRLAERRRSLDTGILPLLAQDPDARVRHAVAVNTSSPPEALERLLDSKEAYVRAAVAANPSLSPEAQERLARDRSPVVRLALARRDDASFTVREILEKDPSEAVRRVSVEEENRRRKQSAAFTIPSQQELGVSDEEYNRIMTEAYRH